MRQRGLAYCQGGLKRSLDIIVSSFALVVLSPLYALVAALVFVTCGPPVLFRQERVGRDGRRFRLLKFRTMTGSAPGGLLITALGDPRVTGVGRLLRASKLDELPQFLNVLRGDMSLVGPRPEVPRYVERYTHEQRAVLAVKPGLTDLATVHFRSEEALLASAEPAARERFYVEEVLPRKLAMNLEYVERASLGYDLGLILKTLGTLLRPGTA